jgi:GTP-binding protein
MSRMGARLRIQTAAFLLSAGRADQFPRSGCPEIAFAGRSNVGKSSMINQLLSRRNLAHTSSTPGRTRTINFYQVNDEFLLVDLPGYGYAKVSHELKDTWWDLVESYLTWRIQLRGVIHILDARHAPTPQDRELQGFLHAVATPSMVVLTKADKVPRGQRAALRKVAASSLDLPSPEMVHFFSAETGEGVSELWRAIQERLRAPARALGRVHDKAVRPRQPDSH